MGREVAQGEAAEKARKAALEQYYRIKSDPVLYAEYRERKKAYRIEYYRKNRAEYKRKAAERYERDKHKYKERIKRWYEAYKKEQIRKTTIARRKRLFGVDEVKYAEMLAAQGGGCAICGTPPNPAAKPSTRTLCVDHDHVTGAVRSLLCHKCNKALGAFPTVELAEKAAQYLKGHV